MNVIQFLFSPSGRVNRKAIWFGYFFPLMVLTTGASIIDSQLGLVSPVDIGFSVKINLGDLNNQPTGYLEALVQLLYLWPGIAITIKRFHDHNMSWWWYPLALVMLIVLFVPLILSAESTAGASSNLLLIGGAISLFALIITFFVILYCLPGTKGPNRFGPDPMES